MNSRARAEAESGASAVLVCDLIVVSTRRSADGRVENLAFQAASLSSLLVVRRDVFFVIRLPASLALQRVVCHEKL